jgi:hypothetical protein
MTYAELLSVTAEKKAKVIKDLNTALQNDHWGLARAEMNRNPGMVAWLWLAQDFCETLADHIDEFIETANAEGREWEAYEISDIYMAYYDDDPNLYEKLPVEAQLFH